MKDFELLLDIPGLVIARVAGEVQMKWEAHLITEAERDAHIATILPDRTA